MKKISKWIEKNTFAVILYLIISAIVFSLLSLYIRESNFFQIIAAIFGFNPVNLDFFKTSFFKFHVYIEENSYYSISYLKYVYFFLFLFASVFYKVTKGKAKRVLTFCLCIMCISSCIVLSEYFYLMFFKFSIITSWYFWGVIKNILIFYISFTILKSFLKIKEYRENSNEIIIGFPKFKLLRSRWYIRLFNVLIDSFLLITLFSRVVFYYPNSIAEYADLYVGERFSGIVVFTVFSTIYYLFFEGVFKTTPGKILTNTSIVSFDDTSVSFRKVVTRTLMRRMPFNGLSFFGKIGWHDSISNTTVVQLNKEESKHVLIYRIVLIAILLLLSYSIYNSF